MKAVMAFLSLKLIHVHWKSEFLLLLYIALGLCCVVVYGSNGFNSCSIDGSYP
jgi:hypothetical protein